MSTPAMLPRLGDDNGGAVTGIDTASDVPAAWYPDPQGSPLLRWWDGATWTARTRERPAVAAPDAVQPVAQPVVAPLVPEPVPPRAAETSHAVSADYVPMADFASAFPSAPRAGYSGDLLPAASAHTPFVWGLALYPLVQLAVVIVITFVVESFGGSAPSIGALGSSLFISLYCGYNDGKILRDRGFRPPGWGWALLPLVYFIIRAVRVGRSSLGPLFTWVGIQAVFTTIIVVSVLIPLYLAVRGDQPLTPTQRAAILTPSGMAGAVGADLAANDYEVTSVDCPPLETTLAGAQVTCRAETPTSTVYVVVETTPSDPIHAYALGNGWVVEK
jgi:hypothetical protein